MQRFHKIWMNEGRRTQVILLDERKLDIVVQPRLQTAELLNIVASHCCLKEPDKAYFGLVFVDEKQQHHWLQAERKALDHDFPRKYLSPGATLVLYHMVKFYVDSVAQLSHPSTVELFFLNAKQCIQRGALEVSEEDMSRLGAFLLQIVFGDCSDDETALKNLKEVVVVPQRFLRMHGSFLTDCEDQILDFYKQLTSTSRGRAVLGYMSVIERQPTYGMHFYDVKDKSGVDYTLGISSKGIFQFEMADRNKPRRVFQWKQLENLYYRDKKFSIEIHDPKRVVHTLSSFNLYEDAFSEPTDQSDELTAAVCDPTTQVSVSRRAFIPSNIHVHVFFCESPQLCKILWSIAIAQHQFYLDRKAAGKKSSTTIVMKPSLDGMVEKLSKWFATTSSLDSAFANPKTLRTSSDLGSSISSQSLPSLQSTTSSEKSEDEKARDLQLYRDLQGRKKGLEESLEARLLELKDICRQEGDVTGEMPKEIMRALKPGEQPPKIRRRQRTDYSVSEELASKFANKADKVAQLEAEVEIQKKVVAAVHKLADDRTMNRSLKKKRQRTHDAERQKLKQLEHKLHQLRLSSSKPDLPSTLSHDRAWPNFYGCPERWFPPRPPSKLRAAKSAPNTPRGSVPDLSASQASELNRLGGGLVDFAAPPIHHSSTYPNTLYHESVSVPHSPVRSVNGNLVSPSEDDMLLDGVIPSSGSFSSLPIYENIGYKTSSAYKSSYRTRHFPTLTPNETQTGPPASVGGRLTHCHRTHSEHSLQSIPSSGYLEPLPDYKTAGGRALDHDVGAYNVPHQRTSWNYDSMDQGINHLGSRDSLSTGGRGKICAGFPPPPPPSQPARVSPVIQQRGTSRALMRKASEGSVQPGGHIRTGLPPPNPTNYGSLDRRFLKNRSRHNQMRFHEVVSGGNPSARLPPPPPSPLSPRRQEGRTQWNESQNPTHAHNLVRRLSQTTQQYSPRKNSAPQYTERTGTPPPPDPSSTPSAGLTVKTQGSSVELTKSYDSNDVRKYSTRVHINLQSPTQSSSSNSLNSVGSPGSPLRQSGVSPLQSLRTPGFPTGMGVGPARPPPPPYGSPRRTFPAPQALIKRSETDLMGVIKGSDENEARKSKTATIV